jgi:hypothetical protein
MDENTESAGWTKQKTNPSKSVASLKQAEDIEASLECEEAIGSVQRRDSMGAWGRAPQSLGRICTPLLSAHPDCQEVKRRDKT